LKPTVAFFRKSDVPAPLAVLAIMAEFLGSLGLAVGLLTRVAALGIAVVMLVAIVAVHREHGFFMNWYGTQQGEGFEYNVLALGLALALVVSGGVWALDAILTR
jgi:putative oxidoreductase